MAAKFKPINYAISRNETALLLTESEYVLLFALRSFKTCKRTKCPPKGASKNSAAQLFYVNVNS